MKNAVRTRHKSSFAVMLLFAYAAALVCPPAGVRAALPTTAKLLPPETAVVVNIENFGRLMGQFQKTDMYGLYKDPSMAAFIDNFKNNFWEKMKEEEGELAGIISEAATFPEGKAAFALVLDGKALDSKQPPVLFVVEWGSKVAQIKDLANKIVTFGTTLLTQHLESKSTVLTAEQPAK